jgi:MoxR-like ATPase
MFNVRVDYPTLDEEKRILAMTAKDEGSEIQKVLTGKAILNLQKLVRSVPVGDYVIDYTTRLVRATRPKDPTAPELVKRMVDFGAGVRAGQYLIQAGKAFAAMDGRFSVSIDDVRKAAVPVLRHRIGTNFQAQAEGKASEDIIAELLKLVGEPEPPKYGAKKRL